MLSRPSPRTQRRYGVSFSVANFFASSSETMASLAMGSPWMEANSELSRPVPRYGNTLVGLHAQIDGVAGRGAQRRVRLGREHDVADLDVKIKIVAEEILGVDGALQDVVAGSGRGRNLRQLHVLRPHRDDHAGVLADPFAGMRLELAHRRAHHAAAVGERDDGAGDEIGGADEIGDEPVAGLLVDL